MASARAQLLVTPAELDTARLSVSGAKYRHLFRARRLSVGEAVRLVDGRGRARSGRVASVDSRSAQIEIESATEKSAEPLLRVTLAVATLRMERAAWLVEKATEIGVAEIGWFNCRRAPRRYAEAQLERLDRVARAAVEQCGRSVLPSHHRYDDWSAVVSWVAGQGAAVVLDPRAERSLSLSPPAPVVEHGAKGPVALIVGPEGGFDKAEIDALSAAGAHRRSLGERTLRAETAAVVASALLLC